MVGRRYWTGAVLRSADAQSTCTGEGRQDAAASASVDNHASDLRAQHGATIRAGSERAGVPEHAVAAVVLAERDQVGATDGRAALRFEPYAFYQRTGHWVVATHKDQGAEYEAFEQAARVDASAAQESVRIGLGQVAGAEAEAAGFADAATMFTTMQGSETAQLDGLVQVITNDADLCTALSSEDWAQVAEMRAGPGYGAISYDDALASYAAAYQRSAEVAHGGDDDDDDSEDDKKKRRKP